MPHPGGTGGDHAPPNASASLGVPPQTRGGHAGVPHPLLRPAEAAQASKSVVGPGDSFLPRPGGTGGVHAPPTATASLGVPLAEGVEASKSAVGIGGGVLASPPSNHRCPGAYSGPAVAGRQGNSDLRKRPPSEISLDDLVARSAVRSAAMLSSAKLLNDLVSRSASRSAARLMSAKSGGRTHNPHIFPEFILTFSVTTINLPCPSRVFWTAC